MTSTKPNYRQQIEEKLADGHGIITSKWCRKRNIPTIYISRLEQQGIIKRIARGIYATPDGDYDELAMLQYQYPKLIFSYNTALTIHGESDTRLMFYQATVPHGYKTPHGKFLRTYSTKPEWHMLGATIGTTPFDNKVHVYSYERVLCDTIRHSSHMGAEEYGKAWRNYIEYPQRDLRELDRIATIMNVYDEVYKLMEVLYA